VEDDEKEAAVTCHLRHRQPETTLS